MAKEIGLLFREQTQRDYEETEKEINMYRSGSALPTIGGPFSSAGGLFDRGGGASGFVPRDFDRNKASNTVISSPEDLRLDLAYLSHLYSNRNLNPRLPDLRSEQRKISRNDGESSSGIVKAVVDWGVDSLVGFNKQKNLVETLQSSSAVQNAGPPNLASAFSAMNLSNNASSLMLQHQHPGYGSSGSRMNPLTPASHVSNNDPLQATTVDPKYIQFLKALQDLAADRNVANSSHMDFHKDAFISKTNFADSNSNQGYYGYNPAFVGPSTPPRHAKFSTVYPMGLDYNIPNLLEEFKTNRTLCSRISDIAGHVFEFSRDQYGSRFIQQKLETAKTEERKIVFEEIFPDALALMTDVFGNYVVQKLLEYGTPAQKGALTEKVHGHVLKLSYHMYGCRVIQKVIEAADLSKKVNIIRELDGHIIRCILNQNANHVIQKCVDTVPEEHIQFIVLSFRNYAVSLARHPYGCRVIQRVLERCMDPQTQKMIMGELLGSISSLAQDQFGNYVVQHVLEYGLPHERSLVIRELAGKIVEMSKQKYASNVVEKCLAYGNATDRQFLVNEMLGSTDENEPLQAMMMDQFGNYVVQKVIETCSDEQRALILSRIKVHLGLLTQFTYGKHIVGRVEQLLDAGEKRNAAQIMNRRSKEQ